MGEYNNPVPIKCWEAFLIFCNCTFDRKDGLIIIGNVRTVGGLSLFGDTKKKFPDFTLELV